MPGVFRELKLKTPPLMRGEDVQEVQRRLIALGFAPEGSADRVYGKNTAKAVKDFQTRAGQAASGIIDAETRGRLFAESAPHATPGTIIAPADGPKVDYQEMCDWLREKAYDPHEPGLLVVGIRGFYAGSVRNNRIGRYDDALFVVRQENGETKQFVGFAGNTDPSTQKTGRATLSPGRYPVYKFDTHVSPTTGKGHPAICQRAGTVLVHRYQVGADRGRFGINIHRGGAVGTSSAGCQTVQESKWPVFYNCCEREARNRYGLGFKDQVYTYILLEQKERPYS